MNRRRGSIFSLLFSFCLRFRFRSGTHILTLFRHYIKETVRKIRKLGVENAAEILSTRDKSAALVLICCFNMKEGHYKRKRPTSGLYHCHNSVYSEEIYNSSEIVGKETKPGFSRYL